MAATLDNAPGWEFCHKQRSQIFPAGVFCRADVGQIKHADEHGEFWSAREQAKVPGYALWQNFVSAIQRAKTACENSGQRIQDHFIETNRMVEIGSKAKRPIQDFHLSRYACYLIVQNADPSKEIVALGQTYFAVRTRRDETREEHADALEEARLRLQEREKLKRYKRELFREPRNAGVITPHSTRHIRAAALSENSALARTLPAGGHRPIGSADGSDAKGSRS